MRRIYESDARHRDGDEPHSPSELAADPPGAVVAANRHRSLAPWGRLVDGILPTWLHDRAIDVSIETDRPVYGPDEDVHIRVTLSNSLPVPITIPTPTRRRWEWAVDGHARAAYQTFESAPRAAAEFTFQRGETKTFTRTWRQRFRTETDRWEPADPGLYEVSAFVAVATPEERGLRASTTIELTG
jgi:hypothetical protein